MLVLAREFAYYISDRMLNMKVKSLVLALLACLSMALSCPTVGDVHVVPGSTSERLEFAIEGKIERLKGLTVTTCGVMHQSLGVRTWGISLQELAAVPANRIRYGQTPVGWKEYVAAAPLAEGCYEVDTWGLKSAALIVVSSDGKVRDKPAE